MGTPVFRRVGFLHSLLIRGNSFSVNLGGWFVLEPFITPTLFQKYQPTAVDEWTISTAMAADTANGGLSQLENHYKTFIVSDLPSFNRVYILSDEHLVD